MFRVLTEWNGFKGLVFVLVGRVGVGLLTVRLSVSPDITNWPTWRSPKPDSNVADVGTRCIVDVLTILSSGISEVFDLLDRCAMKISVIRKMIIENLTLRCGSRPTMVRCVRALITLVVVCDTCVRKQLL